MSIPLIRAFVPRAVRPAPALFALAAASAFAAERDAGSFPEKPADLFQLSRIWSIHLTFTAAEWQAMEPTLRDGQSFGRGRGGGGWDRGRADVDLMGALASTIHRHADRGGDGKVTALGERWFSAWDLKGAGALGLEELRAGLDRTLLAAAVRRSRLQGPEGSRNGVASARGYEFPYARADLEFEGQSLKDAAVRYKGNGTFLQSRGALKRSLKIDLDRWVAGRKLAGVSKLNLHSCVTDSSFMNEVLAHRLYRDAGVPAPRTAYARVYLTVPGQHQRQYLGLYSLVENIDLDFARERFGTAEGTIFKPVTPSLFEDLGNEWADYRQTYDPKDGLSRAEGRRIMELCRLVTGASDGDLAAALDGRLDLRELARYLAVTVFLSDLDGILGPGQNFYLHLHPRTGKIGFIAWDQDHSWGQFSRSSQEARENLSIAHPWRGENRFLERVFALPAFQEPYRARLEEFSRTIFSPTRLAKQVDEVAAAIRPAVVEESPYRAERFERLVAGDRAEGAEGDRGYRQAVVPIKPFVKSRARLLVDQLAGRSEGALLDGGYDFGRGGRGGRGSRDGQRPPWTGGDAAPAFLRALDADRDSRVTREEFRRGWEEWFDIALSPTEGPVALEQVRAGLERGLQSSGAADSPR